MISNHYLIFPITDWKNISILFILKELLSSIYSYLDPLSNIPFDSIINNLNL